MLMLQMLFTGMAAPMIQTLKDFERRKRSIDLMERESSEKKIRETCSNGWLETAGGCSVCFAKVNAVCPSVMTAVPGGDAVQTSPDPIAEDQRKALVFEEGDYCAVSTMHSQTSRG